MTSLSVGFSLSVCLMPFGHPTLLILERGIKVSEESFKSRLHCSSMTRRKYLFACKRCNSFSFREDPVEEEATEEEEDDLDSIDVFGLDNDAEEEESKEAEGAERTGFLCEELRAEVRGDEL